MPGVQEDRVGAANTSRGRQQKESLIEIASAGVGAGDGAAGIQHVTFPRGSNRPLTEVYDTVLLDLDGVVYLGSHPVPGAGEAIGATRAGGMRIAFVTNNASRTPHAIVDQLKHLGVSATANEVVTSAQAAARLVAERVPAGCEVLVVGDTGLRQALREYGLRPVTTAAAGPAAVVQGHSPDLSYGLLAEGALAVRQGAWFVASNSDITLPTVRGQLPGNGALIQVIRAATGQEPMVAGKPDLPLFHEALLRTGSRHPLFVGDRLDTDIEGAHRAGTDSVLVLTGVTGALDLVTASTHRRPTYVCTDLGGLLEAQPAVKCEGSQWTCGGWRVQWQGKRLEVGGGGDPADGLRALCAAAWSAYEPIDVEAVRAAVGMLGFDD